MADRWRIGQNGALTLTIAAFCAGCGRLGYEPMPLSITSLVVHDSDPARAALWSIRSDLQPGISGAHPWGDWPDTYILSVDPAATFLLGNQWIAVAAESKKYTGGPQATITMRGTLDLYMLVDDRWGTAPSWTAGWTVSAGKMTIWESIDRPSLTFGVYQRPASSGSLDLPQIGDNVGYNYIIVAE